MAGKRIRTNRSRTSRRAQRVGHRMSALRNRQAAAAGRRGSAIRRKRIRRMERHTATGTQRKRAAPKAAPRKHSRTITTRSKSGTRRVQVSGMRNSLAELRAKQGSGRRRR